MAVQSYAVLLASILSHTASNGFNYGILGALTTELSSKFHVSLTESSWTGSVHIAIFLMMAPLSALLTRMIPIRKVQLFGTFLTITGVSLCCFATEYWHIIVLFGVVAGIGMSLVRAASTAILPHHFDKENINFALSAVMIGMCLGLIMYPVLSSYLFSKFGFSYTMLLLSPLMSLHIIGVMFYSQSDERNTKGVKPVERKLVKSLLILLFDEKVWSYAVSGFFRKFAVTSFFSIANTFIIEAASLTKDEAAQGSTTLGCTSIIGAVLVSTTHYLKHSRLIPHAATSVGCGLVMIAITYSVDQMSYTILMAIYGFLYGIQVSNLMGVANEVAGHNDMVLALALEQLMEGIGSLIGSPISSYMQEQVGQRHGIFISAAFSVMAGCVMLPVIIMKCKVDSGTIYHRINLQEESDMENKEIMTIVDDQNNYLSDSATFI